MPSINGKLFFIIILIICSIPNSAKGVDEWICKEAAAIKNGSGLLVCGVGEATQEGDARSKARENAFQELETFCNKSADCQDHKLNLIPSRNQCEKHGKIFKCYRGIRVEILSETRTHTTKVQLQDLDSRIREAERTLTLEIEWLEKSRKLTKLHKRIENKNYESNDVKTQEADDITSIKPLKKLCETGDSNGCQRLAALEYQIGNHAESIKINALQCRNSNMSACRNLGLMEYNEGHKAKAKKLFMQACENGLASACADLGEVEYYQGNKAEAKRLLISECSKGKMLGCGSLGAIEYKEGNKAKAKQLLKQPCENGVATACYDLGNLEHELGSKAEARGFYTKSCEKGLLVGCYSLGVLEWNASNFTESFKLFNKACSGGYEHGCKTLARLTKYSQ